MWLGLSSFFPSRLVAKQRSPYQTVYVYDKGTVRYMRFASEGWQGAMDMRKPARQLFPYQRYFQVYRAWLTDVASFLSIGVGTGTAMRTVRQFHRAARLTGVDLDPVVMQSAVRYFDCPSDENSQLVSMHGRAFLETAEEQYDLIFHDTYDSQSIPHSMRTIECFSSIRDVMTDDGLLIVNAIGCVTGPGSASFRALYKTLMHVFTDIWVMPTARFGRMDQNILLIARNTVDSFTDPHEHADPLIQSMLDKLYRQPIPVDDVHAYLDSDNA